jgi:uncharacterized membrane protein (DUF4010 family)
MELELGSTLGRLGIAVGIGLLVGLQRERAESPIAGLRTFALTALLGALTSLLALEFGGWVVGAGIVSLAGLVVTANLMKLRAGLPDPGLTTEVAILLTFGLAAYLMVGYVEVAIVTGGALAFLLHAKARARRFVETLGEKDVAAVMRFALLTLVILPVLPNQSYGPFDVLNPRQIWLMVVLIVGIGFAGYLAYRFLGARAGTALSGILGGTISSTATTVSYARRAAVTGVRVPSSGVVIMIASTVVFVRVLVEMAVVVPEALPEVGPPVATVLLGFAILSFMSWRRHAQGEPDAMPEQENPTELRPALVFGGLYGLILLAVAAGENWFGAEGLYVIALISGMTDMDAITLSTAHLTREGRVEPAMLWRVVLVASLSNLVFKLGVAWVMGGRALARQLAPLYGVGAAFILLILFFWPLS